MAISSKDKLEALKAQRIAQTIKVSAPSAAPRMQASTSGGGYKPRFTTGGSMPSSSRGTFNQVRANLNMPQPAQRQSPSLLDKAFDTYMNAVNSSPVARALTPTFNTINKALLNAPVIGGVAKDSQDLTQRLINKRRAGQNIDAWGDVAGPGINTLLRENSLGYSGNLQLDALAGGPQNSRDIKRGVAQYYKPLTLGLIQRVPGFETPETAAGKVAGGISEAAGFATGAMLTAGATAPAGKAVAGAAERFIPGAAGQFAARIAPTVTNAALLSAAQDPGGEGVAGFIDPAARVQQGLYGGLMAGVATGVGGLTGKALEKSGASPFVTRLAQGIAGGASDTGIDYARGERDPAKLLTRFGLGAFYGYKTGPQDYHDIYGDNPGAVINAVRSEIKGLENVDAGINKQVEDLRASGIDEQQIGYKTGLASGDNNARLNYITQNLQGEAQQVALRDLVESIPSSDPNAPAIIKTAEMLGVERTPRLGEDIQHTKTVVKQQGVDAIVKQYSDEVEAGRDPARAYEKAVKQINEQTGSNIPVKVAFDASKVPDTDTLLDPNYNLKQLNLPEAVRADLESLRENYNDSLRTVMQDEIRLMKTNGNITSKSIDDATFEKLPPELQSRVVYTDQARQERYEQAATKTYSELDSATAGYRVFGEDSVKGVKSSFPEWIPKELRSRKVIDQVLEAVRNNVEPKTSAAKQLYDVTQSRIGFDDADLAEVYKPVEEYLKGNQLASATGLTAANNKDLLRVQTAIEKGSVPKEGTEARRIYDEVKAKASGQVDVGEFPESPVLNRIQEMVASSAPNQYNLQNLVHNVKQAGVPFETQTGKVTEIEKINSITDLDNLKVSDEYKQGKIDGILTKVQNKAKPLEDLGLSTKAAVRKLYGAEGQAKVRVYEELAPALKENGISDVNRRDFEVYSAQLRNENLVAKGDRPAESIAYPKDGLFGHDEVVPIPTERIANPQFDNAFKAVQDYQQGLLDRAYEGGVITKASYEALKDYGDYVPFQRLMEEQVGNPTGSKTPVGSVSKQNIIQAYKGSDKSILSPLESIVTNTIRTEKLVNRNNVAMVSIRSMQEIPELNGLVKEVKDTKGLNNDEYISVLVNGEKKYFTAPPEIVSAAKNLDNEQMNTLTKIMAAPARLLRQGATSSNIDFMIPNVLRDQFNAGINSEFGYRPLADYASGFWSMLKKDQSYRDYLRSGAEISFGYDPKQAVNEITSSESGFTKTIKTVANPLKLIQKIGEYSEVPTRVGLYKRAMSSGADVDQAVLESRSATSDFAVRGSETKSVAAVIPFLNARVQGFDSTVQAFKRNPARATTLTAVYAVLPTILLQGALEQTPVYNQISDYDKDKYYIIPLKGANSVNPEDFAKVPKPEIAQWLNPIRKSYEMEREGKQINPGVLAADIVGNVSPIGGIRADMRKGTAQLDVSSFIPQAIKPAAEVIANYDFYRNRPIVSASTSKLPAAYQANSSTDPFFKQIGKELGLSPAQLQQLAYGYGGGVAKQIANASGAVTGANSEYPSKVRPGASAFQTAPIVNRFLGVDLNTPEEQQDQYSAELRDLKAQYDAIRKSRYIPANMKDAYINDIRAKYTELASGRTVSDKSDSTFQKVMKSIKVAQR